jgi:hypothetical protein
MASQKERDEARVRTYQSNPTKLFVNKEISKTRPLFGRATSSTNQTDNVPLGTSPSQPGPVEDVSHSRIPRRSSFSPDVTNNSSRRNPTARASLKDAYEKILKEEEQDMSGELEKQGSPSPAPRPTIRSRESDERRLAAIRRSNQRAPAPIPELRTE